jgi:predicted nucleotidyltransferase
MNVRQGSVFALARRLRAAGGKYATLFGSLSRGTPNALSDIDLAVSFGRPMPAGLRTKVIAMTGELTGRAVDLVDLETASSLILASALRGRELLCVSAAMRRRMIARLLRSEGDRRTAEIAARAARSGLFA